MEKSRGPESSRCAYFLCAEARLRGRGFQLARLGEAYRQHPRHPENQEIKSQKDDQARIGTPLRLDDTPDEISADVADQNQDQIVYQKRHDLLRETAFIARRPPSDRPNLREVTITFRAGAGPEKGRPRLGRSLARAFLP